MNPTGRPVFFGLVLSVSNCVMLATGFPNDTITRPMIAEFVPPDAKAVLVIRPRMLLSRLPDEGLEAAMYWREYQRTSIPRPLLTQVSRVIESSGLLLNEVEEIGVVFGVNPPEGGESPEDTNADEADVSLLPPDFMFMLRFRKTLPDDIPAALLHKPLQHKLTDGLKVFTASEVSPKYLYAIWLTDAKTIAVCPVIAISRVLEAKPENATGLRAATNAMPSTRAGMLVGTTKAIADVGLTEAPSLADASYVRLNLDIATPDTVTVSALYPTSERANAAAAQWLELRPAGKALIDNTVLASRDRDSQLEPSALQSVAEIGASFAKSLDGVQVASKGNRVDASVPLPLLDVKAIENLMLVPSKVIDRLTLEEQGQVEGDENPPLPKLRRFDAEAVRSIRKKLANDEVASELFRKLPQATGLPASYLLALAKAKEIPTIKWFEEQPVSALFFDESCYADSLVDRRMTLYFASASGSKFFDFIRHSMPFGTASLINCEDITSFECACDGETAKGIFSFESRMVIGSMPFTARQIKDRWEFVRFELPAWGLECRRNKAGEWEMADDFGRIGSTQPTETVRIKVMRDGKPLTDLAGIELYRDPQLFPQYGHMQNGSVRMSLFPGRYFVALISKEDDLPERYREAVKSGLVITIPQNGDGSDIVIDLE